MVAMLDLIQLLLFCLLTTLLAFFWAGCPCCGTCACSRCSGTPPAEFDVTLDGFANSGSCHAADHYNGETWTLSCAEGSNYIGTPTVPCGSSIDSGEHDGACYWNLAMGASTPPLYDLDCSQATLMSLFISDSDIYFALHDNAENGSVALLAKKTISTPYDCTGISALDIPVVCEGSYAAGTPTVTLSAA
jgi:hypothetical protein